MGKKYKEATFHSSVLIPWFVVAEKKEEIDRIEAAIDWINTRQKEHYFSEPDEVCHKDNLFQKMTVKAIIKVSVNKDGSKPAKTKIVGIRVYWWEDS